MLKRTLLLGITIFVASTLLTACAVDGEDVEDLGPVTDGKGDFPEIRDREVTLKKRYSTSNPSKKTYSVLADVDFRVELRYEGDTLTRITVTDDDTGERFVSEK